MSSFTTAYDVAGGLVDILEQHPDDALVKARIYLSERALGKPRDIAIALCSMPALYKLPKGREQLFALSKDLSVSEMELVESMTTESILWGNDGIPRGWDNIKWLVEHKQLASRKDLCVESDKGVLDLLVDAWTHNVLLHASMANPEHQRVWVADLVQWLVRQGSIDEQTQSLALRRAAVQSQNGHNLGLILGLLDAGVPWKDWLEDAPLRAETRTQIEQHPGVRRWRLGQAAKKTQAMETPAPGKRKM